MFVAIKEGILGASEDVWKCNSCHALNSRINRLKGTHGNLVQGFQNMDHSTKEDFMSKAGNMFKAELTKAPPPEEHINERTPPSQPKSVLATKATKPKSKSFPKRRHEFLWQRNQILTL